MLQHVLSQNPCGKPHYQVVTRATVEAFRLYCLCDALPQQSNGEIGALRSHKSVLLSVFHAADYHNQRFSSPMFVHADQACYQACTCLTMNGERSLKISRFLPDEITWPLGLNNVPRCFPFFAAVLRLAVSSL